MVRLQIMPYLDTSGVLMGLAIAAVVIALFAYRWFTRGESVKMRAEIRQELDSLRGTIEALPAQLESARLSQTANVEEGPLAPESLRQWLGELDAALSDVTLIRSQLAAADTDFQHLSDMELEFKLMELLALSMRASSIAEKYRTPTSADDGDRDLHDGDRDLHMDEPGLLSKAATAIIQATAITR